MVWNQVSAQTAPLIKSLWLDINDVVCLITDKEIELGVILILNQETYWNFDFIRRQLNRRLYLL